MTCCKQAACVLLGLCILAMAGCGGSAADDAMQEMYDVMLEAKKAQDSGDAAQGMALLGRMLEATQKVAEEVEKMSPEEQKAFTERWEKKFKAAGLGSPPSD